MKIISIVAPSYNEEENIDQVIKQVCKIFDTKLNNYDACVIVTDHTNIDYEMIYENSQLIIDTRNVFENNIVEVTEWMSDEEIIDIIDRALEDKQKLSKMIALHCRKALKLV